MPERKDKPAPPKQDQKPQQRPIRESTSPGRKEVQDKRPVPPPKD